MIVFAGQSQVRDRTALVIECKDSRVGKKPVTVPAGVTVNLEPGLISCKVSLQQIKQLDHSSLTL